MALPPHHHNRYTVGWICPIVIELTAATLLLDTSMLDENDRTLHVLGDNAIYNVGKIGRHYVVVVGCSQMGNSQAATIVTNMQRSFPNIKHILVVGIAGGVPSYGRNLQEQIVLGDVVVSVPQLSEGGVKHYDFGAWLEGDFEPRGHLLHPSNALLQAVINLRARHTQMPGTQIPAYIKELRKNIIPRERKEFQHPGSKKDRVFEDDYLHQDMSKLCEDHCDPKKSKLRKDRGEKAVRKPDEPFVHYGIIGSSSTFIASNTKRRELYNKHNIICFEMEAAGVMSDNQGLIIRGISDYSDSHTNKLWQGYAATTAAAYAKELILMLSPDESPEVPLPEHAASREMIFPHRQAHPQHGFATTSSDEFRDPDTDQRILDQGSDHILELCSSNDGQGSGKGLCSVRELNSPKEPVVDIVFVHGLAGNSETTWTNPRSQFFWPKTLVADAPRARVMFFGWTTNKPKSLPQGVESLEANLLSMRCSHPDRPLIFVSHGVGGLLCQQTLLKNDGPGSSKTLLSSISALVFFGSPVTDIALTMSSTYANKCAKFCEDSEGQLRQRLVHKTVKVLNCYPADAREELLLINAAYSGAKNSSYINGEKLEGNHSNMTSFQGQKDAGYQLMLRTVRAICCANEN